MNSEISQAFITHSSKDNDLDSAIVLIKNRIKEQFQTSEKREELYSIIDRLSQFDFGRFLLIHRGVNGFWTRYMVSHPRNGKISDLNNQGEALSTLEKWMLERMPVMLATQERFLIFKDIVQRNLRSNMNLASIPCGLMDDLLELDYSELHDSFLTGIDLDRESLKLAQANAETHGLAHITGLIQSDAWKLGIENKFDLIVSNGLNIYETDDDQVTELYKAFYNALRPGGILVVSFMTPPPTLDKNSVWNLNELNIEDLAFQKILFSEVLQGKFQAFRSPQLTEKQLINAGFKNIEIIYDKARLFPTATGQK